MKNNNRSSLSVFQKYYSEEKFEDRYQKNAIEAVDVIIPVIHTNELWRKNLISIYREIPVARLLIGDGGCIDDSLAVVKDFPRVKIFNHNKYKSLGFSIKKLIEAVETEWFIYLHSDVYLPDGWFDAMKVNRKKYDWFECRQQLTILADYPLDYPGYDRPLSGSQMGKKAVFKDILPNIADDYLYRNEDMIYAHLIKKKGYRYGRVDDVFHYHQVMDKKSRWGRWIKKISIEIEKSKAEKDRENIMQTKAIIKYMDPSDYMNRYRELTWEYLLNKKDWNQKEFEKWVAKTNPLWLPYIRNNYLKTRIIRLFKNILISFYIFLKGK